MKRITTFVAGILATLGAFAQTSDNFNARPGASLTELKGYLQNSCWQFPGFDINAGWVPGIEGDGAMVSTGTSATDNSTAGIRSQMLSMSGNVTISFKYAFSTNVTNRRWLKIYLTDGNGNVLNLSDSLELTGAVAGNVYTYNKTVGAGSGCYKVFINYAGIGTGAQIAIDQLVFSSNTCYTTGCNQPPVAVNDNVAGTNTHEADGTVLPNDSDPEHGIIRAHLVTNSPDGTVDLSTNGFFTFTPNPGFSGTSTTFTYMICDNGSPSMCSNVATVTLSFPITGTLPATLVDLSAQFNNDVVTVKWTTTFESNNDHFEVERSTDGISFKSVGNVAGHGTTGIRHDYEFGDEVKRSTLTKNDLYYRLKQVDANGKSTYTKVLVVRVYQTKTLQSLSVTPNPTVNDIKVNVQLNESAYIVMKVMNNSGAEIIRKTSRGTTGMNNISLEGTSHLQAGIYLLEVIINSKEHMMVKLVKN